MAHYACQRFGNTASSKHKMMPPRVDEAAEGWRRVSSRKQHQKDKGSDFLRGVACPSQSFGRNELKISCLDHSRSTGSCIEAARTATKNPDTRTTPM